MRYYCVTCARPRFSRPFETVTTTIFIIEPRASTFGPGAVGDFCRPDTAAIRFQYRFFVQFPLERPPQEYIFLKTVRFSTYPPLLPLQYEFLKTV